MQCLPMADGSVKAQSGLDLGHTGKNHDGVDGDARTLTKAAIANVKARTAGPGPADGA